MNGSKIRYSFHDICKTSIDDIYKEETKEKVIKLLDDMRGITHNYLLALEIAESLFFLYLNTELKPRIINLVYELLNREDLGCSVYDMIHKYVVTANKSLLFDKVVNDIYEGKHGAEISHMCIQAIKDKTLSDNSVYMNMKIIKDIDYLKLSYENNLKDKHADIHNGVLEEYGGEVVISNPLSFLVWYMRATDEVIDLDIRLYLYIKLYEYDSKQTFSDFNILLKEVHRMNNTKMISIYESGLGSLISSIILEEAENKGCSGIDINELESICEDIGYYDGSSYVSESIRPDKLYEIIKNHFNIPVLEDRARHNFLDRVKEMNEGFVEYKIVPDFSNGKIIANVINRLDENIGVIGITKHKYDYEISFMNANENTYLCDLNYKIANENVGQIERFIVPYYTVYVTEDLIDDVRSMAGKVKEVGDDVSRKINNVVNVAVKQLKNIFTTDDREEIIKGGVPKASRLLKMALVHIAILGINPALGIIAILTNYCMSSKANDKARSKILNELKAELEIIEEKIKDADGDKKAKYQLMRVRQQINKDIDRIRYKKNLDD